MKIIIYSQTGYSFDSNNPFGKASAGADYTLLRLITALSKSNNLVSYIPTNTSFLLEGTVVNPFYDILNTQQECDLLIIYRKPVPVPYTITAKKVIYYAQDDFNSPCYEKVTGEYFNQFSKIIVLSEYHKKGLQEVFNINTSKLVIIGNASVEYNKPVIKKQLDFCYCSTPYRGLLPLLKMWKKIINVYPQAKLHIFSSMKIYDQSLLDELHFSNVYKLMNTIQGIVYHGTQLRETVMDTMAECKLLLYPNTFPETYCNVINEARAVQTPFITTDLGALKETGGQAGIYISGSAYTKFYQDQFIIILKKLITDEEIYTALQSYCLPCRTWEDYNKDVNKLMKELE